MVCLSPSENASCPAVMVTLLVLWVVDLGKVYKIKSADFADLSAFSVSLRQYCFVVEDCDSERGKVTSIFSRGLAVGVKCVLETFINKGTEING